MRHTVLLSVCIAVGFGFGVRAEDAVPEANPEHLRFFETQIRPLLSEHCFKCHGEKAAKGGVKLDSLAAMLRGGDSGPAIVPGKPDESLLIEAVRYEGYEMPPDGPLEDDQIEALATWVRLGAPWPGTSQADLRGAASADRDPFNDKDRSWWAVSPVSRPAVPTESGKSWAINEIDHFVARQLERHGMSPAPPADKATLIRRLSFDLIGLPPTPEQIERFVGDTSADAYESLVDRLLDSPAYGQRFARHWLDVARYADSDGYRADHTRPNSWRYRDYVIDSLNDDKPYDQFVKEQIAGDELFPDDPAAQIATGFLTHGIYEYNSRDVVGQWDIMLNEVTDTIGDVFLGVGMQCARCHDHKFDPILQKDYFALRAFVEPILIDRETVCATAEQLQAYEQANAVWLEKTASIRQQLTELEAMYREKAKRIAVIKFPESIQAMMHSPPEARTPREHQYAVLADRQVDFEYDRMDSLFSKEDKDKILALRRELQEFDNIKPQPLARTQAVRNVGEFAPPTVIPKKRSEVQPDFLSILGPAGTATAESDPEPESAGAMPAAGRRSALANWIASPDNPLSTRVIVNRVWQSHFGKGLAPNASDFGFLGGAPNHPELLDWLTSRFIAEGWRLKPLHRKIVTSATYRQSSRHPESARLMTLDPRNQWYWRRGVRRLDAEQIRDSILAVSGVLDAKAGGPAASDDKHRRSIYTIVRRNSRNPLLDAFDLPLFFSSTASRDTTTNPLQSLMLINSQALLDHAKQLAERTGDLSQADSIEQLWRLAYGRKPSEIELSSAQQFIQAQQVRYQDASEAKQTEIETNTLPYRDGSAVVIKPDSEAKLRSKPSESLRADEFTVEAIFQLGSIYETGAVRTIVSTWTGSSAVAGWSFGVTGKGSRRKPQTLVLHAFGSDGKKSVTEAAVFSDQQVDIGKPYYAAASVRLASGGKPGEVTFYLKDLSDEEQPVSVATMGHDLVGGLFGQSGIAVGGRPQGSGSAFDGLIDDIRVSRGVLGPEELLLRSDLVDSSTIGYWRFEPSTGLGKDDSTAGIDLQFSDATGKSETPQHRALIDLCHVLLNSSEFLYVQ